jgi:hypothetical protein
VAELRRCPRRASIRDAVEDETAADPGSEREQEQVASAPPCTEAVLGEGRRVGVVVDSDRKAESFSQNVSEIDALERNVHGRDCATAPLVDQRRDAEADGVHAVPRREPFEQAREVGQKGLLARSVGRMLVSLVDVTVAIDHAGKELRPAEIDPDDALARQVSVLAAWLP